MALEIERKFLLKEFPYELVESGDLVVRSRQRIEQTYLAIDETQELRVRRITDLGSGNVEYTHTFKRGNGLSREEIEYSISQSLYDQIVQAFRLIPLTKERTTADWGSTVIEIDQYDQLELLVVEVEFASLDEALGFTAPDWFGQDISKNRSYSNKTVWRELQQQSAGD
ncbi:CYTH domain-containing protein [Paenibacillus nasutitermitis]|uniref:Adenylate cyclase n=1 Tax=Paenibacillus nasutitermitis TaxID=1652958 RepID=A0A917E1I5_9BACL|nr:CYTH domain-containing protein [Paenibacillus nasutitermitis]GGD89412.1 adenylate cyclase [Paenibacillus nasutitermitis]